jgi:hypothetical protein
MTLYGFKDRRTAENLKSFGETMNFNRTPKIVRSSGMESQLARVTALSPITKMDETTGDMSFGDAVLYSYSQDGTRSDTDINIVVFNGTGEDLEEDDDIEVVRVGEKWVKLSGSGGGGSAIYQLQSTTLVTAASGLTVGSGSANILELQTGGTAYIALTGTPVDVRNPWAESIELGSIITAHKDTVGGVDYFIVIQASCPTETP